jgi:RimJ/RimL family protein N-acetyltransferase
MSVRKDMPHQRLQEFSIIDFTQAMVILATKREEQKEEILGLGQYGIDEPIHTAEVALVVRDDYHYRGIGTQMLVYLTYLAKRQGLLGFTAQVLVDNRPMIRVFEKMGFDLKKRMDEGVYDLEMKFKS